LSRRERSRTDEHPGGGLGFVAITAGVSHLCGLSTSGVAACWGENEGGQFGDGIRTHRTSPFSVRIELRFSSLTAGSTHTCGLAGSGVPIYWGSNMSGQLGDGTRNDRSVPRTLSVVTCDFEAVHTCGHQPRSGPVLGGEFLWPVGKRIGRGPVSTGSGPRPARNTDVPRCGCSACVCSNFVGTSVSLGV